jgi:hypothetical protein
MRALLNDQQQRDGYALNCHEVGQIVSFDAAKQSATVKIMVLRVLGSQNVEYPLLTDCPVFVLTGGDACLTMPVKAGDSCLVLFNDRDLDNWFTSGSNVVPNTARAHDLSDGLVLVGFRNLANVISEYSTSDAVLRNKRAKVGAGGDEHIIVENQTGSLKTGLDNLVTGLDALCTALTGWVDTHGDSPNPATIAAITAAKALIDASKASIDAVLR